MGRTFKAFGGFRINEGRIAHQNSSHTHHAVHQRNQLRHLGHLHRTRCIQANGATDDQTAHDPRGASGSDLRAQHSGQDGQRHADHAVEIATPSSLLIGQTAQAEDEENGCADVRNRRQVRGHELRLPDYFLNIANMRCVTAKPPNMLMAVSTKASDANTMINVFGRAAALAMGDI